MANSIRDVKKRITSTKKTAQITKAMNMVSASKLKGAERAIREYLPFITKAKDIIINISTSSEEFSHPLMEKREIKKTCYVVVSSDRGLAGAFNSNVIKEITKQVANHKSEDEYVILPLGLKAYSYAKKNKHPLLLDKYIMLRDEISFSEVSEITHSLVMSYLMKKIDRVVIIYNHYVNTLVQEVKTAEVLPINKEDYKCDSVKKTYEFEGTVSDILNLILPIYIENYIYGLILDSKASEHASRMNSMKNATDNASEVISSLELLYNRARQAAITLELTDIVGGASVINEN